MLSSDDLDRLRAATGARRVDPARGLFAPGSTVRRVNREAALVLGGGRALLLQVAHPLVAAAVSAHSRFEAEPLERLTRTLDLTLAMVFADAAGAMAAVRAIERVHRRVRGALEAPVGPFPRGTTYDAGDPELVLWVQATLVDTALVVYQRFVAPLSAEIRAAYWTESKVIARLLGVPERLLPRTEGDFHDYVDGMIASDLLTIGPAGHRVAGSILRPPVPFAVRPAFAAVRPLTVGLLPATLRARYGLGWGTVSEAMLSAFALVVRASLPLVAERLRVLPQARRGEAWEAGVPRPVRSRTASARP